MSSNSNPRDLRTMAPEQQEASARGTNVPLAPYPPSAGVRHANNKRSSLRSSPNYSPQPVISAPSSTTAVPNNPSISSSDPKGPHQQHRRGGGAGGGGAGGGGSSSLILTARAKFCHPEMVAAINTLDSTQHQHQQDDTSILTSEPVLLELKRLKITLDAADHPQKESLFHLETVGLSLDSLQLSPLPKSMISSTCLDVAPFYSSPVTTQNKVLPIATGLSTGALCVHTAVPDIMDDSPAEYNQNDHDGEQQEVDYAFQRTYIPAPRSSHVRPATAVAWRPHNNTQIAVAWGNRDGAGGANPGGISTSVSGALGPGTATIVGSAMVAGVAGTERVSSAASIGSSSSSKLRTATLGGSGKSEYGCYLWDINTASSISVPGAARSPVVKLAHQIGVSSLGWVLGGSTLAVGGQLRHAHLYDLRAPGLSTSSSPIATIYAHNFMVSGIEPDPHHPHQFATFCSFANEPVKIWDARRTDKYVSEIRMGGATSGFGKGTSGMTGDDMTTAVHWSTRESGILSVSIGETIHDYDTSSSRPLHVGSVAAGQAIADFCLYPYQAKNASESRQGSLDKYWIETLYSRRTVVVHRDREVRDMAKHRFAPLAISRRDGRVVNGLGQTLWVGPTGLAPAGMESLFIQPNEDISSQMMRLARCLRAAKYSMDASSNIKMFAEDGIVAYESSPSASPTRDQLLRLWIWIERIEAFCNDGDDFNDGTFLWPVRGLMDAGTLRLLRISHPDGGAGYREEYCAPLARPTYDSPGRRAALAACGWAGKFDLTNVLRECEELGEYERSAALALWHGDVGAAVSALQRGASAIRAQSKKIPNRTVYDPELMDLVALSIAGYRGDATDAEHSDVWRQACSMLMQRVEESDVNQSNLRTAYMIALLGFLTASDPESAHDEVLSNDMLSLSDRVGFACRFLPRDKLQQFLQKCVVDCQISGNLEGLVVTGIENEGMGILQSFVDIHSDVQTAALVTSRLIFPPTWVYERRVAAEWLDAYRSLLNTWQMWQSRAMFDVDRASLLRKIKAKQQSDGSGKLKKGKPQGRVSYDPDVQAPVPVQLDARCNYCSSPLLLRHKDGASMEKLSKMKPILSCCPNCTKPLPRCAICMLSLGTTNPYLELVRRMSSVGGSDDMSNTTNLPFAEWFAWCMKCKHGGHAHHMVGWFANHEACPVSGCGCRCQFDGVQKLNRPASSASVATQQQE